MVFIQQHLREITEVTVSVELPVAVVLNFVRVCYLNFILYRKINDFITLCVYMYITYYVRISLMAVRSHFHGQSGSKPKDRCVWPRDDAASRQDISIPSSILIKFEATEYSNLIQIKFQIHPILNALSLTVSMFQRVLMGVQPAAQRKNAQVVKMASSKRTRLVQVNGDMSLNACVYGH